MKGYQENGKTIPFATNMGGAFEHAAEHGNKSPYNLPESWMKAKSKLDLKTPLNFVSTADIIGGNSGSPTVNKKGEVVGIIFDGNIESLPWNFAYQRCRRGGRCPWTRAAFRSLCARSIGAGLWRTNSWEQTLRQLLGKERLSGQS